MSIIKFIKIFIVFVLCMVLTACSKNNNNSNTSEDNIIEIEQPFGVEDTTNKNIKDSDFEQFISKLQKELMDDYGKGYTWFDYIDSSLLSTLNTDKDQLLYFAEFYSNIKTDYKEICSLSAKNKYYIQKKVDKEWKIWEIRDESNNYPYKYDYSLICITHEAYLNKDDDIILGHYVRCDFAKINGEWKITCFFTGP